MFITKKVELIDRKKFAVVAFAKNEKTFVVFVIVFTKYINFANINDGSNKDSPFLKHLIGFVVS